MDVQMARYVGTASVAFPAGKLTTSAFDCRAYAGGQLHVGATFGGSTVGFLSALTNGGTYRPAKDNTGAAVTQTGGTNRSIQLPDAVMAGAFAKITRAITGPAVTLNLVLKG